MQEQGMEEVLVYVPTQHSLQQTVLPGTRMIKHVVAGSTDQSHVFNLGLQKTLPALVLSMTALPISGYRAASISVAFLLCVVSFQCRLKKY